MTGQFLRAALGAAAMMFACSANAIATDDTTPTGEIGIDSHDPARHDPLEEVNRVVFEVNGMFYEITTPIVEVTPDPIRGLFRAVGTAASAPFRVVANIATGDPRNERLADIARDNDVDCGYFVVLPFAGPTTTRDAIGTGAEIGAGVVAGQIIYVGAGSAANDRIEAEVEIRQLDSAIDKYALARSATLQDRGCVVVAEDDAPAAFGGETPATEKAATGQ
jgi:ABC-type transporter lipoprotein component MlaA